MRIRWWGALALWLALIGLAFLFADRPFATFSHDTLAKPRWGVWLTWLADTPYLLALGVWPAALLWRLIGGRLGTAWRIAMRAGAATVLAILLAVLLKTLAGRTWPETWVNNNPSWIRDHVFGFAPLHGGLGWRSFPSGHMARIAAPFAVLGRRVPRLGWVCVLVPALVAAGLLASDYHFVSDCLAGALLGTLVGVVVAS